MKNNILLLIKKWGLLFFALLLFVSCKAKSEPNPNPENKDVVIATNPMNLNYRFQFDEPGWREAADPVCEYFNGKYYLFASKSGGYWSSTDLANWNFIPCQSITELNNYAPSILILDNYIYWIASGSKIYRTNTPDTDNWELIDTKFNIGVTDPAFFLDEDGKVYLYWGCSDKDPIMGVQVDPENGFAPIGEPLVLIEHHIEKYGWEIQGENNESGKVGWNEGPCMIKYNEKYYLQYASPGTQFRSYADGIYIGQNPLGPFNYGESSPFSFKPGGFIGGAGHGHTFQDKYGNYWHVASMKISQRHMFERRLGLFPLFITEDGIFAPYSAWTDYPFVIPQEKTDFKNTNFSLGWNLLSYKKAILTSSTLEGFLPSYAANEQVENWWSASTGNPGEWLQIDLGDKPEVKAIQVNFADQDFTIRAPHETFAYQYYIEASDDKENWKTIVDKTKNTKDAVHELIVLDEPIHTRYLRITNAKELPGKFSLYGFRVFGKGNGAAPEKVTGIKIERNPQDARRYSITWDKQGNVTGYIIHAGINKDQIYNDIVVYDNYYEGGWFNRDSEYYFRIEAFNENGSSE